MYVEMKHVDEHCSNNNKTHENDAYKPEISRENKKREAKNGDNCCVTQKFANAKM